MPRLNPYTGRKIESRSTEEEEVHDIASTRHELFLDGFCLTDKRGSGTKKGPLRYVNATDLQNLLTSTKLTLTQRANVQRRQ
jgi:hypothetical protein